MELLISIVLLSLIVLGFTSINIFSRYHVISADRRAKLQNEASYILEHMTKNIGRAIGDIANSPIDRNNIAGNSAIRVRIDSNNNGQRDAADTEIVYRYRPAPRYEVWYYSNYTTPASGYEVISSLSSAGPPGRGHITSDFTNSFVSYFTTDNFISVRMRACWDPTEAAGACDNPPLNPNPDNPSVTMQTRVKMPSVSTN